MRKNKKQEEFLYNLQQYNLHTALEVMDWSKEFLSNQLNDHPTFKKIYNKTLNLNEKQKEFIEIYPKTLFNITRTCKIILIDRKTFYRWKKESKAFRMELENIREGLYDDVESVLFHKIFVDRDTTSLIFFMKTQMKHRGYSEKADLNLNMNSRAKCNCDNLKDLSNEELNERIKFLEKIVS